MFTSEDRQLRAIHLILDFEPLSSSFQDVGNAIRVGNPWLTQIDVLVPGFLAREDLPLVKLPFHHSPCKVAAPKEETASSCLSLEVEINQFHFEEEGEAQEEPMEISDSEGELDRSSVVRSPRLIVTRVDNSFKEEEEMALNPRKGLKGLASKDALKFQPLPALPPSPFPPAVSLLPIPNLKKKRKEKEKEITEEGEVILHKEPKQQKTAKDRGRASSIESREAKHSAYVRHPT